MSALTDLARGWFRKGDSDLATASLIAASIGPYDTACFHAQQAAEKYLKGFLSFHGLSFPFTHNLEELEQRCATTAQEALYLAEQVRAAVLAVVPPTTHP